MIPRQRLKGRLLRIVLTLDRTNDDWFVSFVCVCPMDGLVLGIIAIYGMTPRRGWLAVVASDSITRSSG